MQFLDELLERIREMIQSLIKQSEPTFCYGLVTAVNPLKIKVKDSYEIDEEFIILDSRCRHTVVKVPVDGAEKHIHTIDEKTLQFTAIGNLGAPIQFAPMSALKPNPSYNPDLPEDPVTNPKEIPDMSKVPNPTVLDCSHAHTMQPALPEILLWRGLKVGDKVKILRLTGGSIHYVFERVERLDNPGTLDDSECVQSQDDEENWA